MNKIARTALSILVALVLAILMSACANGFSYTVNARNYGHAGVIIREPALKYGGKIGKDWLVTPGLPVRGDIVYFHAFSGYPGVLPDKVEIVWQLAELSSCQDVYTTPKYPGYVRRDDCDWHPIPGKVFRKTIDMEAIRASEAYKHTGEPVMGSHLYGTVILIIELIFNEDTLRVETRNSARGGLGL